MVFARVEKNRAHTENKNLKSGKLQQQAVLRVKAVTRSRLGQTSKNAREIFVAPQPIENKNEVRTIKLLCALPNGPIKLQRIGKSDNLDVKRGTNGKS